MPELTCKQVNERIAKALGWTCRKVKMMYGGFAEADGPVIEVDTWFRPDGSTYKRPDYCHDLNACAEAEREIAERGLVSEYGAVVATALGLIGGAHFWSDCCVMLLASAETRARALVEVLEETA